MAVRTRYPLAATLPAEVLERTVVARLGFPVRLLLILGVLPLLLAASALIIYRQQQSERIYTGVRVYGLDLSRMTRDEAAGALKRHLADASRRRFALRFDEDAILVSLGSIGLAVDDSEVQTLVTSAWSAGRNDSLRSWLRDQLVLLRNGFDVPVVARFDRARAATMLGAITTDVERVTLNAGLSVERAGAGFEVHTSPAQIGRRLNVVATLDKLQQSIAGTLPEHVDLVLDQAPPAIRDEDLLPARAAIEVLLGGAMEFRDGTRSWRLDPAAAFEMLEVTGVKEGKLPIEVKLNDEKLARFVEQTARAADQPAQNPTFAVDNDQVVVRPGRPGRLADAAATLAVAREKQLTEGARAVDVVFKEDLPWVRDADLHPARDQMNALLDLPITLEAPVLPVLPGVPALPGVAPVVSEKKLTLGRQDLLPLLILPNTQTAPRDLATLPVAQRPRFEPSLDGARLTAVLTREITSWVSQDPVDAAIEMTVTKVDVPNPAFAASPATSTVQSSLRLSTAPTLQENRYAVGLRNARDGRGPDYNATAAAVQALFRTGAPVDPAERRVTVRVAPRAPRVTDLDLAPARDLANVLVSEPVLVRWRDASWAISRDDLAGMLRYQPGQNGKLMAYLTRDGLIAKAGAIASEANRRSDVPRGVDGNLLPLDVPQTAGVIWEAANRAGVGRTAEVVWAEDRTDPPLDETAAPLATPAAAFVTVR